MARIITRNISEFSPSRTKKTYRITYTALEKGSVKEYFYGDTSIYTRSESWMGFAEKPFTTHYEKDHLLVFVPRPFIDNGSIPSMGWLVRIDEGYYVYRVDRYALWAGLVPKEFQTELDLEEPEFKTLKVEGEYLVGSSEETAKAWKRYRQDLLRREGEKGIRIRAGRSFSLVLKLVKDGVIPYSPQPVKEVKRLWGCDIQLREYQKEALKFFLNFGNVVLLWPAGAGKTTFSIKLISELSGKTLIVCPGLSLIGQWEKKLKKHLYGPRIAVYAGNRREQGEVTITTYIGAEKFKDQKFTLCIYDEVQHIPAPTYSKLAFMQTEYRLGLSATPWREDGHSEYIYGLCGFPYGDVWDRLVNEGWIKRPPVFVHITPYKLSSASILYRKLEPKLIIYSDSIDQGKQLSTMLNAPFVYGKHSIKRRLEILEKRDKIIASRVFDEGMDIPGLRSVIEYDFLYGSRRQEAQRAFRLCHSAYEGIEHHILMTPEEYEAYGKRLWGLYQRGLEVKFIKD